MKKVKILLFIFELTFSLYIQSQNEIILNTSHVDGGSKIACESIILQPGFSFVASSEKSLILQVDPLTCISGESPEESIKDILSEKGLPSFTNENFVYTITYTQPTTKVDASKGLDATQYFDGLGRPVQAVQRAITPNGNDLVIHQEYDSFGRESKVWLPGVSTGNGAIVLPNNIEDLVKASYDGDNNPFSMPEYEASPLNRILEQYGPGDRWHNEKASIKTAYLTNNSTDLSCVQYTVKGTRDDPELSKGGNYISGELYVTRVENEAGHVSFEFKDKLGQVVLTRQKGPHEKDNKKEVNYDTYYVFDDFGNLCFVLPPKAANNPTPENLIDFVYQYKYDDRNRCIAKKIPGAEWINFVYDKADRLILSQDGEQRLKNEWTYNKYDNFGRVIIMGICSTTTSHEALRQKYKGVLIVEKKASLIAYGYTWATLKDEVKNHNGVILINHYDDYEHMLSQSTEFREKFKSKEHTLTAGKIHPKPKGLLVGTRVMIADVTGWPADKKEIVTAIYYDNRGRIVQTQSSNHLRGKDEDYIAYNYSGQPTQRLHVHKTKDSDEVQELYTYEYDHAGRLLATTHKLGDSGQDIILAQNEYDDLGRLKSIKSNKKNKLKTSYAYNIRSWTETINNPNYYQNMSYTLNGNVDWMKWRQNDTEHTYNFVYDKLSRLTAANYDNKTNGNFSTMYSYDMHGNMVSLSRRGEISPSTYGEIDKVTFTYNGNQMRNASDAIGDILIANSMDFKNYANQDIEYAFNHNGAMTMDLNRGVKNITYNALNLPQTIEVNNTSQGKAYYTYSAAGQKLCIEREQASAPMGMPMSGLSILGTNLMEKTDYVGNFIYEDNVLKRILVENGYIENGNYYFYLKDHLGNNRIVTDADGAVVQSNEYYPFGLLMASSVNASRQPYKYNNKELDTSFDLNWYDFSARYQDGIRFTSIDPLAEKYYSISPYAYVANNPLKYIDPTGMFFDDFYVDWQGTILAQIPTNEDDRFIVNQLPEIKVRPKGAWDYTPGPSNSLWTTDQWHNINTGESVFEPRYRGEQGLINVHPEFEILLAGRIAYRPLETLLTSEQKFYRAMSNAEFASLEANKGLSYMTGKELFVSTSADYSSNYLKKEGYDVLVEFTMKRGAMKNFNNLGVFHRTAAGSKGWASRGNLLWKTEGGFLNLGIQQNTHLFNPWIKGFKTIP